MALSEGELAEARETIKRALDEDLRYGPDVTTSATVPDGATTTASLITREPGVIAGVDVALLVLDEVLGAGGYRVVDRVEDGARLQPGASALTVRAPTLGLLTAEQAVATPQLYLGFAWRGEQALISGMMLVVGLVTVISWDSTFPDRLDVMVLSPLPLAPRTILLAKLAASASLLGLAIATLNFATGIAWPLLIGSHHDSVGGFFQSFAAYWFTMIAASAFIFCSVLTVQGFSALLLPRRIFLVFSALMQLAAFGTFLGAYFLLPSITPGSGMAAVENHAGLAWSPRHPGRSARRAIERAAWSAPPAPAQADGRARSRTRSACRPRPRAGCRSRYGL